MRGQLGILLLLFSPVLAFKPHDFKLCHQTSFCRRGRGIATRREDDPAAWKSPYTVDAASVALAEDKAAFTAAVKSSLYPEIKFGLELRVHDDGVVRVRMDEVDGLLKRYDEAASWALIAEPVISRDVKWTVGKRDVRAKYGAKGEFEVVVEMEPLKVSLFRNGKEQVVLNGRGLLHMEHFRKKEEPVEGEEGAQQVMQIDSREWFEGQDKDGIWEETWSSWKDSKPKGPESLSLDISFPNHGVVYGIPQHATDLALPATTGEGAKYENPFRLWNSDVFEYTADGITSLYGSIPVMHAHSADSTVAVFNAVGSETWIDISHPTAKSTDTHWISESGILDVFIMPGPTPRDVFKQYAGLTGTTVLPAHWALGYHQCRWNYISSDDVRSVQRRFDEEDMPLDVIWLDIEYAPDHKYFIWKEKEFPDPVEMTNDVAAFGRKMVVIIDPHLKRAQDFPVYKKSSELEVLVKPPSGEGEYEGWCWSGNSAWVDFFNPVSWAWWHSLFQTKKTGEDWVWEQSTEDVYIWNDMNEPSVFNGPEISMPRDNIHFGGWEHRDVHNINGMLFTNQTAQGLYKRSSDKPKRPFVLTRSFYAGSQRFGAMWTGDNLGTWEHMAAGIKMVLANNIAGFSFAGSDVGGFFGNPEPEMLVRWYQVGIWNPFFRAHGHIDTKRREPYLLAEPYKSIVRDLLRLRYAMLPVWYTAFHEASVNGMPVVRPHYVEFPQDEAGFKLDDQYFIGGSGLLVKPVTTKGATEATVYLSEDQVYYDYVNHHAYRGAAKGKEIVVPAELHQTPLFIRGGSIIPTRERPRRSSPLMKHDPFTLRVALSQAGSAAGELYLDDGESYDFERGELVWRRFAAETEKKKAVRIVGRDMVRERPAEVVEGGGLVEWKAENAFAESIGDVRVERIVVLGLEKEPKSVEVEGGRALVWEWTPGVAAAGKKEGGASVLVIKDPGVPIAGDWEVVINL